MCAAGWLTEPAPPLPAAATTTTFFARAASIAALTAALATRAAEAQVDDARTAGDRPRDPLGDGRVPDAPGVVRDLHRHDDDPRRDAADADAVAGRRRDDPGDVRAVAVLVGRVAVARSDVDAGDEAALQVGVAEVDPAVDDGDDDLGAPAGERPGSPRADRVGAPLRIPELVVGGADRRRGRGCRGRRRRGIRRRVGRRLGRRVLEQRELDGDGGGLDAGQAAQLGAEACEARPLAAVDTPGGTDRCGGGELGGVPTAAFVVPGFCVAAPSGAAPTCVAPSPGVTATYCAVRASGFQATRVRPSGAAAASTAPGSAPARSVTRRLVGRLRSGVAGTAGRAPGRAAFVAVAAEDSADAARAAGAARAEGVATRAEGAATATASAPTSTMRPLRRRWPRIRGARNPRRCRCMPAASHGTAPEAMGRSARRFAGCRLARRRTPAPRPRHPGPAAAPRPPAAPRRPDGPRPPARPPAAPGGRVAWHAIIPAWRGPEGARGGRNRGDRRVPRAVPAGRGRRHAAEQE